DPAVQALRAKVRYAAGDGIPVEAASVTVRLADGTTFTEHVEHGRGTPGRPMSDPELDTKVRELAGFGAPFVDAPALIAALRAIEDEADVSRIIRLTMPE